MPNLNLCYPLDVQCKICGCDKLEHHLFREMMFRIGDEFEYLECKFCGCIQIADIPVDLDRYYPHEYYSFDLPKLNWKGKIRNRLIRHILCNRIYGINILGLLLDFFYEPELENWLAIPKVRFDHKILDVGCGSGHLLLKLHSIGYKHLQGIDPYLESEFELAPNLWLRKFQLSELEPHFDFIMLHHSLEHMPDQHAVMHDLHRLLSPNRCCLVRIPIAAQAWREYGKNWVQLDAPRHLYSHSDRSFRMLAEQHGFNINRVVYDSTAFQFWASEQYQNGITLYDPQSLLHQIHNPLFRIKMHKLYGNRVIDLNLHHQGDQACFYLRKK